MMKLGLGWRWAAIVVTLGWTVGGWSQARHRTATKAATKPAAAESAGSSSPTSAIKNVFWQPSGLKQGSPAFITVELEKAGTRVSATLVGKTIAFFKTDDAKVWYALAGVDLDTKPGSYTLAVTATLAGGHAATRSVSIALADANFKAGTVEVAENFVEPDAAGKRQIASDEIAKARAYAHVMTNPLWSGNFAAPVSGKPTDTFGESRILNEERSSTHRGTDFPVNEGSSVVASNSGTVVLAKDLFYEGGCVIVDHGERLFTIYMHLSKIGVAVGDEVQKGAKLGLSGATGRVTGPHLHMGVRWNGAYVDPVELLAMTLPKTAAPKQDGTDTRTTQRRAAHR